MRLLHARLESEFETSPKSSCLILTIFAFQKAGPMPPLEDQEVKSITNRWLGKDPQVQAE